VLWFPVLDLPEGTLNTYQDTSAHKDSMLNQGWFAALLPVLALPFAFAGTAFAGVFQRLREHIGALYGGDLIGGAIAAVLFLPALSVLAGPDVGFAISAVAALGALISFWGAGSRVGTAAAAAMLVGSLGLTVAGLRGDVLHIQHTSGFSEKDVTYTEWTPLVRVAVHETPRKTNMLLDNTSASEVGRDAAAAKRFAAQANRGFVYEVVPPGGRVAILAASAGPEVVVARQAGFTDIEAVDLESALFRVVAERFADAPNNPYADGTVKRVHLDARAAIAGSPHSYRIIQMVHANLWSAAGMLANTWSPALLETVEAFETYLDHLDPDGVISFGRGPQTNLLARAASTALQQRGVDKPWQAIAWVEADSQLVLIRPRAWTPDEQAALAHAQVVYNDATLQWPVDAEDPPKAWKKLVSQPSMTDDRPYVDTWADLGRVASQAGKAVTGDRDDPLAELYRSVFVQLAFVLSAGLLFVALPWALRGRSEVRGVRGVGWFLGYVACLGYGYLAVETVLVHQLVLFVGHPTYAITLVVLTMLMGSGAGSIWLAARAGEGVSAARWLRGVLVLVLVLATVCGIVAPPLLSAIALGAPLWARGLLAFVVLLPLGFVMGGPFPLSLRAVGVGAGAAIPWAWALNGWMSVLASMGTVVIARLQGYNAAYAVALSAYLIALLCAGMLPRVGQTAPDGGAAGG
jgi:hypothetical protein